MNEEDYYTEEEAIIAHLSKDIERKDREIAELRQGLADVYYALGVARDVVGSRYLGVSNE